MALIPVRNTFVHFGCGIDTVSNSSQRSFSAPGRHARSVYDPRGDAKPELQRLSQPAEPDAQQHSNTDWQEVEELSKMNGQTIEELSTDDSSHSVSSASSETSTELPSRKRWHKDFRPSKKHREAYRKWKGQLETKLFEDAGSFDIDALEVPDWVAPKDHVKVGLLQRTQAHLEFLKSTMR